MFRLLIDADGCPVVDEAVTAAKKAGIPCIIVCDTSHVFEKEGAKTVTVSKGADSADFALVNLLSAGDLVVTQDYGLAAMCLSRRAIAVNQDGMCYDDTNISALLEARAAAQKIRRTGGRLKGPKKRTEAQDLRFAKALDILIAQALLREAAE